MFLKIAGFEFRYQIKNPVFWVGAIIFFLLAFLLACTPFVSLGGGPNVHRNAPLAIVTANGGFITFYMFVVAAFVSNVIIRDDETGFGPILRATRISKFSYLYGRFLGAFAALAVAYLSVTLGMVIGSTMPWLDKETLGPFVFDHYWKAYLIWGLPNVFIISALLFSLATITRSMAWTYVGVVGLFIGQSALNAVLGKPGMEAIAALWSPFGGAAFRYATQYWTTSEANTLIPPFAGYLVANRALWLGIGAVFLAASFFLYSFQTPGLSGKARKAQKLAKRAAVAADAPRPSVADTPLATPSFGAATAWGQFFARARLDFAQIFRSPAYPVLLAMAALLGILQIVLSIDVSIYGGRVYPLTRVMIQTVSSGFTFVSLIVAVYYSGELVWRELDRKTHEIIDATPTPDWAFVVPKVLAISLLLISTIIVSVIVCTLMQVFRGAPRIEFDKYFAWYFLPQAVGFIEVAAFSVFVQSIVPHKFWGWGVMFLFGMCRIVFPFLGLEHNLLLFGGTPEPGLTDLHGTGIAGAAAWWFRLYWGAIALILLVLAYGLWRRGTEQRLRPRLGRLPGRLKGGAGLLAALGLVTAVCVGGFIFYNTDVLNTYRNHLDEEKKQADYEKTLLPFENVPQPKITDVMLNVDLHPKALEATTQGVYVIENKTAQPIRELHVRFDPDTKVMSLSVEGARPTKTFERFNYRILTFDAPMQPGEKRRLSFQTWIGQKGFKNEGNIQRIADNGSFINNFEISPQIGMDRNGLLQDRAKRKRYGLPPEVRLPKLEDVAARQFNLISKSADFVNADITVTTDADQTPIAPGYTVSDETHGDRRTVHFKSDAPILPFFDVQSGRFAIKRETYKGVNLAVYYDPKHPWNVDRMMKALEIGLDYDQANFSPYQFHQVRIVEFPGPIGTFAQSFANTLAWSEGIGFTMDVRDKSRIDLVTYVAAHELGHQWWAHQVIGANVQGVTMLDETFAQYSAIMAMEHLYGRDQIRRFLKYELDNYLKSRGTDPLPEQPLYRVENQQYIHYRKGSVVMYRLKDQLGEDVVNRALRRLLHDYAFKGAPYPVSTDFLKDLREEAGPDPAKQQIITDLFEKITVYDLKAKGAVVKALPGGKWDVALTVQAGTQPGATGKEYDDGSGKVVARPPLDEVVELGLFAKEPGKVDFGSGDVILMQRVKLKSGEQTVHFTVDRKPVFAGVDPYNTLIDRNTDDNVVAVGK